MKVSTLVLPLSLALSVSASAAAPSAAADVEIIFARDVRPGAGVHKRAPSLGANARFMRTRRSKLHQRRTQPKEDPALAPAPVELTLTEAAPAAEASMVEPSPAPAPAKEEKKNGHGKEKNRMDTTTPAAETTTTTAAAVEHVVTPAMPHEQSSTSVASAEVSASHEMPPPPMKHDTTSSKHHSTSTVFIDTTTTMYVDTSSPAEPPAMVHETSASSSAAEASVVTPPAMMHEQTTSSSTEHIVQTSSMSHEVSSSSTPMAHDTATVSPILEGDTTVSMGHATTTSIEHPMPAPTQSHVMPAAPAPPMVHEPPKHEMPAPAPAPPAQHEMPPPAPPMQHEPAPPAHEMSPPAQAMPTHEQPAPPAQHEMPPPPPPAQHEMPPSPPTQHEMPPPAAMQHVAPPPPADSAACQAGAGSPETDLLVLNFANALEALEATFYKHGLAKFSKQDMVHAGLSEAQAQIIIETLSVVQKDEDAHLQALTATIGALGGTVVDKCQFNFEAALTDPVTFLATARALEAVGVSAYAGGAGLISDKSILTAAAQILPIEARHQSVLNILNAGSAIPQAFDQALLPPQVLALAGGFLTGCTAADLGLTSNAPLSIRNKKTASTSFIAGDELAFTSTISADPANAFCAMLVGGASETVNFPLEQCAVPAGVDGPVFVFLTSSATPLAADINKQAQDTILAGPGLIFVEGADSLLQNVFSLTSPQQQIAQNAAKQRRQDVKYRRSMATADIGYVNLAATQNLVQGNATEWWANHKIAVPQQEGVAARSIGWERA